MIKIVLLLVFLFSGLSAGEKEIFFSNIRISVKSAGTDNYSISSQTAEMLSRDISASAESRMYGKFIFTERASDADVNITVMEETSVENAGNYIVTAQLTESESGKTLYTVKSPPVNVNGSGKASFEIALIVTGYLESYRKIVLAARRKTAEDKAAADKNKTENKYSYGRLFPYGGLSLAKSAGSFSAAVKYASGIKAGFGVDDFCGPMTFGYPICPRAEIEYYSFVPAKKTVAGLKIFSFCAGAGKKFSAGMIDVIPCVFLGYQIEMMNYDYDGSNAYGMYDYSAKTYYDPFVKAVCETVYCRGNFRFIAAPFLSTFFEKDNTGLFYGISIGAGYMF